jgi:protoheme IX farnesyltransferase
MKEYVRLMKPGIIMGNLIAALGGFFLASKGHVDWVIFLGMSIGLSFVIGSACVFNNIHDRFMDEKMTRTKKRPLVTKTVELKPAFIFGILLLFFGILTLWKMTTVLALICSLVGFFVYVFLYTPLKPKTYHGTLVGAIAGAMPPVVGYVAVVNKIDTMSIILFLIFAFWQMPHFFAIALYRMPDYAQANIPIHPIIKGVDATKKQIAFYTFAFSFMAVMPFFLGYTGWIYFIIIVALSAYWFFLAFQGLMEKKEERWAKKIFGTSLLIVTLMSVLLGLDYRV